MLLRNSLSHLCARKKAIKLVLSKECIICTVYRLKLSTPSVWSLSHISWNPIIPCEVSYSCPTENEQGRFAEMLVMAECADHIISVTKQC